MEKSRAIELLKLAVPIKALTQQEYSDFVEAVNMGMDAIHCNIVVTGRENAELVAKTIGEFVDRIKALPTIQPEPQEGEWVDGRCNKCGGQAPFWVMASTYYESAFCPHCGAKMKGV